MRPTNQEELQAYVDNLSGLLHLLTAETQTVVHRFKFQSSIIKTIVYKSGALPNDVDSLLAENTAISNQLNSCVSPLVDELRRLIVQDGVSADQVESSSANAVLSDSTLALKDLGNLANSQEELYSQLLAEYGIGIQPDAQELIDVQNQSSSIEKLFPAVLLKFLASLKSNVSIHLRKMAEYIDSLDQVQQQDLNDNRQQDQSNQGLAGNNTAQEVADQGQLARSDSAQSSFTDNSPSQQKKQPPPIVQPKPKNYVIQSMLKNSGSSKSIPLNRKMSVRKNLQPQIQAKASLFEQQIQSSSNEQLNYQKSSQSRDSLISSDRSGLSKALEPVMRQMNIDAVQSSDTGKEFSSKLDSAHQLSSMAQQADFGVDTKKQVDVVPHSTGIDQALETERVQSIRRKSVAADFLITSLQQRKADPIVSSSAGNLLEDVVEKDSSDVGDDSETAKEPTSRKSHVSNLSVDAKLDKKAHTGTIESLNISLSNVEAVVSSQQLLGESVFNSNIQLPEIEPDGANYMANTADNKDSASASIPIDNRQTLSANVKPTQFKKMSKQQIEDAPMIDALAEKVTSRLFVGNQASSLAAQPQRSTEQPSSMGVPQNVYNQHQNSYKPTGDIAEQTQIQIGYLVQPAEKQSPYQSQLSQQNNPNQTVIDEAQLVSPLKHSPSLSESLKQQYQFNLDADKYMNRQTTYDEASYLPALPVESPPVPNQVLQQIQRADSSSRLGFQQQKSQGNSKDQLNNKSGWKQEKVKYLADFKFPSVEDDKKFLSQFPVNSNVPEVYLQAINGYHMLPNATPQKPYLRLEVGVPVRIGRSNTNRHPNFVIVGMTQVISRNHFEISEYNGDFFVADVGSNSGTWLNGDRLSEAGQLSAKYQIKTGDIIRVGADFKQGAKSDEVRDIRHKCIVVRVVVRPKAPYDPASQQQQGAGGVISVSRQTESQLISSAQSFTSTDEQIIVKTNGTKFQTFSGKQFENVMPFDQVRPGSMMTSSNAAQKVEEQVSKAHTKFYLAFTASTLPYKVKRLAVHNPNNSSEVSERMGNGFGSSDPNQLKGLEFIGPEIMSVNLQKWGSSKELRQKLVIHDLRIPTSSYQDSQVTRYGTALEIVKESSSDQLYLILVTGEPYSAEELALMTGRNSQFFGGNKVIRAFKLGTINPNFSMKYKIEFCFEPLPGYITDTVLMDTGPTTCQGSRPQQGKSQFEGTAQQGNSGNNNIPLMRSKSTKRDPSSSFQSGGARNPYDNVFERVDPQKFPSLVIVGEVGGSSSAPVQKQSAQSGAAQDAKQMANAEQPEQGDQQVSPSQMSASDKSKTLVVLKRALPSRIQKLVGEVKGKQIVKKSVRETRWIIGMDLLEDTLWSEFDLIGQQSAGLEFLQSEKADSLTGVKWVYRKEWWSLVLIGSMIYAHIRD
ncbi:hypothetical protein MP228_004411 [Amoeboaphelidium protococcarum]|nr:hypothetical protein MP228_004411 [Amoeboaphelidium protococcarum]